LKPFIKPKGFKPEYGLYNPEAGIYVYHIDADFPLEADDFKLNPRKILS